uniref:Leiomodin-3 n=1 Tax=Mola mola TaxID=94237 RepID=A0A3Q3X948_MOLML
KISGFLSDLEEEPKEDHEVDEDQLLATLSSEELQELERELVHLDDNVPAGMRQPDQTSKTPTGGFNRAALLKYWEDEYDGEQVSLLSPLQGGVHFQTLMRRGREPEDEVEAKDECKKAQIRKKCHQKNSPTKSSRRTENTDRNLDPTPNRPSGNPTVIDKTLEQILCDDPTMSEVNLNNIEDISQETLLRFAEALRTNTHVHVFSLANTHADDRVAFAISKMLCENRFIRNLNIESNYVSGQGILALLAALKDNRTLEELRFHNQRHICGGKVEMEMVKLLRENTSLLKLGYQFDLPGPRMTATSILTHNQDQQRQTRRAGDLKGGRGSGCPIRGTETATTRAGVAVASYPSAHHFIFTVCDDSTPPLSDNLAGRVNMM